jgi:hypothetical protein
VTMGARARHARLALGRPGDEEFGPDRDRASRARHHPTGAPAARCPHPGNLCRSCDRRRAKPLRWTTSSRANGSSAQCCFYGLTEVSGHRVEHDQTSHLERLRARRRRHRGRLHRPGNAALRLPVLTRTQVSRIGVVRVAALARSETPKIRACRCYWNPEFKNSLGALTRVWPDESGSSPRSSARAGAMSRTRQERPPRRKVQRSLGSDRVIRARGVYCAHRDLCVESARILARAAQYAGTSRALCSGTARARPCRPECSADGLMALSQLDLAPCTRPRSRLRIRGN